MHIVFYRIALLLLCLFSAPAIAATSAWAGVTCIPFFALCNGLPGQNDVIASDAEDERWPANVAVRGIGTFPNTESQFGYAYLTSDYGRISTLLSVDFGKGLYPDEGCDDCATGTSLAFAAGVEGWWSDRLYVRASGDNQVQVTFLGHFSGFGDSISYSLTSSPRLSGFFEFMANGSSGGVVSISDFDIAQAVEGLAFNVPFSVTVSVQSDGFIDLFARLRFTLRSVGCDISGAPGDACVTNTFFDSSNTAAIEKIVVPTGVALVSSSSELIGLDGGGYAYVTSQVPEPASVIMFLTGLMGVGWITRRNRSQARFE